MAWSKSYPTHEPVIRVDEKDILFVHESDKYKAIVQRVKEEIAKGRQYFAVLQQLRHRRI